MTEETNQAGAPVEDYLDFPDGRVHVLCGGTGEPVLFLHAAGGAGQWQQIHELLAHHFTVYAPDHPGFGKTDELPEVEAMDDLVFHYLDVIDKLGVRRPHIVGGSFGGWLAAELAVAAPHAIGSVVLLGAAGLRLPDHPITDLFLLTPAQLVPALFHDPGKAAGMFPAEFGIDDILAAYRDQTALARFGWAPFLCNPKLDRRLPRITAPTRVVWAEQDAIVPLAHGQRYAERIPNAELRTVPDCGHAMYFEQPTAFADLITEFLTAASPTAQ